MTGFDPISAGGFGLEIFDRVRDKLVNHPDPAADSLAKVFSLLDGMYTAVEQELAAYSGLTFWEDMDRVEFARRYEQVARLRPEPLRARFADAQAHCTTFTNIYNRFLSNWFQRWLDEPEANQMANLFSSLGTADDQFVASLDSIASELGQSALQLRTLMEQENWSEINRFHRAEQRKVDEWRDRISAQRRRLGELRKTFQQATGATATG